MHRNFANNNVEPMVIDMAVEENDNTEEEPVIVESTSLDLETYANCYTGLAKLQRLIFIADRCPQLRVEALRMAIFYVQTTYNVNLYTQLHRKLQEAVSGAIAGNPSLPDIAGGGGVAANFPALDMQWVESRAKKAALKLEKLDTDLKNSKVNSIKESIRRGHDDLGDHYLDCGDLSNALKCYSRARDYCTSFKHIINMCLNVIKVSIYLNNWSHVLSYVSKAQATPEVAETRPSNNKDQSAIIQTKLTCASGLAQLATRKYKILYAKAVEERSMTFERSLEMGREHIMRVKGLILRSALIKNQIHVKSPPREGGCVETRPVQSSGSVGPQADLPPDKT
ncbi:COP9 signalosome complex subunit 1 [Portunus trituberculatus]|uniref:COP9 signalosome complex subunit 1 n=1 Tax=Portunus trituberculatus TaxID=210409 RepID=A0A5B7DNV8_PORTR|nr:COP9 signalosome complex subunit 1 [Portunus trituberculatus]